MKTAKPQVHLHPDDRDALLGHLGAARDQLHAVEELLEELALDSGADLARGAQHSLDSALGHVAALQNRIRQAPLKAG